MMTIELNHTIVPARNRQEAAEWFARIFGLATTGTKGHFTPVRVNDRLTLLFDNQDSIESHHLAFHVSDQLFDEILHRIKSSGTPFGSGPVQLDDGELNHWNEGRGVYFKSPDGHILELMTVPQ
jgi:catechol 2,3-dioxygenase-like lactoylglutathione lyase family enzyme